VRPEPIIWEVNDESNAEVVMKEAVLVESDLPKDWRRFRMPSALHARLQDLLDKQDREGKLTPRERREAQGLTELVDMLSVMRVRGGSRR
jgi:hypothetical protein